MLERRMALDAVLGGAPRAAAGDSGGAVLREQRVDGLLQVSAWPETVSRVAGLLAEAVALDEAPGFGRAATTAGGALLRVHPLTWWLVDAAAPARQPFKAFAPDVGTALDLTHSRVRVAVSGESATVLLNRFLPLDLRDSEFPDGSVAASTFHHVSVLLHRQGAQYLLYIPRGFAVSLFELLTETAAQFGPEIRAPASA